MFKRYTAEDRANRSPYYYDDLEFAGKKMHRITANVTMVMRSLGDFGQKAFRATKEHNGKPQDLTVVFKGQRVKDFEDGAIMASMEAERQVRLAADNYDYEDISRTLILEGYYKPRNWKDHQGNWHKEFHLHVAKWHFQTPDGNIVEEGALPAA